jgi:aryl-alcohol dehydrogenase-like predicted oxidoreductase
VTGARLDVHAHFVPDAYRAAAEAAGHAQPYGFPALLAQGGDIVPIPGTKRVSRVEENTAADAVALTAEQIARLDDLTPAAGDHHNEAQMRMIER